MERYYVGDYIHCELPNGNRVDGEIVTVAETPDGTEFYTVKMYLDDCDDPQYETVRDDCVVYKYAPGSEAES
jgi:hypothetical protein